MTSIHEKVTDWLNAYGRALTADDLAAIADSYVLPALVVADGGVVAVNHRRDVDRHGRRPVCAHRARRASGPPDRRR